MHGHLSEHILTHAHTNTQTSHFLFFKVLLNMKDSSVIVSHITCDFLSFFILCICLSFFNLLYVLFNDVNCITCKRFGCSFQEVVICCFIVYLSIYILKFVWLGLLSFIRDFQLLSVVVCSYSFKLFFLFNFLTFYFIICLNPSTLATRLELLSAFLSLVASLYVILVCSFLPC